MAVAIGIGALLAMALAAAAARSMWLAMRRHEQEIAALRAAIDELIIKLTAATNRANPFNEEMQRLAERAEQEIAALHALLVGLDTKYTALASRVNGLVDDVNEETKRLLAERDPMLNEKVASLTERIAELKQNLDVKFDELAKRLSATKLAVAPQRRPSILPIWKLWGAGLVALLCGFAFGDDLGDATLGPVVLEDQIQSLNQHLDRVTIDFERRLDRLDILKTNLERRLDRLDNTKTDFEWRLDRLDGAKTDFEWRLERLEHGD